MIENDIAEQVTLLLASIQLPKSAPKSTKKLSVIKLLHHQECIIRPLLALPTKQRLQPQNEAKHG